MLLYILFINRTQTGDTSVFDLKIEAFLRKYVARQCHVGNMVESNKDKIDVLLNSPLRVSDWLKTTMRRRVRADHFLDLSLRSAVFFSPLESLSSILSDIYRLIKIFP